LVEHEVNRSKNRTIAVELKTTLYITTCTIEEWWLITYIKCYCLLTSRTSYVFKCNCQAM